ncbi:hypothetical protein ABB29_00385 [Pseudoxanthomonas dokdonensis]|uniref:D-alanyl-D-alanine dipeptidase n=2 Tax=Pseudoxanthomonas dokdonensis TaxID=344882 RepID=A0A0R0CRA8_9GAMM|nr:hypothetical protein ABB29_00385 [Pseudoxanthomonas dokdonensis]
MKSWLTNRHSILIMLLSALSSPALAQSPATKPDQISVSTASTPGQANLIDVATLIADAQLEIRYAGQHNFVGRPVDGYQAAKCYLLAPAATALAGAANELRGQQLRLRLFDCYRPVRAVKDFVSWAHDLSDQKTKPEFYPRLRKSQLLDGYIAESSGHSRGATVDLSLDDCSTGQCIPLDMGTGFDLFDTLANTDDPRITAQQRENRQRLLQAMQKHGFANYPLEWWHYTLKPEPTPDTAYDVPVR